MVAGDLEGMGRRPHSTGGMGATARRMLCADEPAAFGALALALSGAAIPLLKQMALAMVTRRS
ncbi:MAG: hypothetical protein ACK6AD_08140 [Cyanobacteriota bacterium]